MPARDYTHMGEITTPSRHIRRRGLLATLTPVARALLCPCDECVDLVMAWYDQRIIANRIKQAQNPPCPFCGMPMIWRELAYVCPYAESAEQHRRIRDRNLPFREPNAQTRLTGVRTTEDADRGAARGVLIH